MVNIETDVAELPLQAEDRSFRNDAWQRLKKNRAAIASMVFLAGLAVICACAQWIAPYPYAQQDLVTGASSPSLKHWLGTDTLGRDLLTRLLYGGQISLLVGLCATLVSLMIGVPYGMLSGYCGGKTDAFKMRFVDILYTLPFTILVIILMVVFGRDLFLLFAAIGAVEWLTMARIIRGDVLAVKEQTFIKAAIVLGLSRPRIIFRHIMPNVMGTIIVYTTLTIPRVMLLEAFLSFLGLGVQPPMCSWGLLIRDGAEVMESFAWLMIIPGALFSMTLFALNFLGDGLRDALDPRFNKT